MTDLWRIVAAGILAAILASGLALLIGSSSPPTYRAETELAILPSAAVPPDQVPAFWEALGRGQVPKTSAEVLGQPQWLADAARTVGRPPSSLILSSGVVPGTTLIKVTLEADSAPVAEQALRTVIARGSPLASLASGPFVLVSVYGPEGTATPVGAAVGQLLPMAAVAGLLVGIGLALLISRRRSLMARLGLSVRAWGTSTAGPEDSSDTTPHVPSGQEEPERAPTVLGRTRGRVGSALSRVSTRIPLRRVAHSTVGEEPAGRATEASLEPDPDGEVTGDDGVSARPASGSTERQTPPGGEQESDSEADEETGNGAAWRSEETVDRANQRAGRR